MELRVLVVNFAGEVVFGPAMFQGPLLGSELRTRLDEMRKPNQLCLPSRASLCASSFLFANHLAYQPHTPSANIQPVQQIYVAMLCCVATSQLAAQSPGRGPRPKSPGRSPKSHNSWIMRFWLKQISGSLRFGLGGSRIRILGSVLKSKSALKQALESASRV